MNSSNVSDEEEENFVRNIKRVHGKYKGKLTFKCFECGIVGHFSSKFPFTESRDGDSDEEVNY